MKQLVAELIGIRFESIRQFEIMNPETTLEIVGDKFCRLDINMTVDNRIVDLEIQFSREADYPQHSLYYWAHEYSTAIRKDKEYNELPQAIDVCILAFALFDCDEYHSEFKALEVTRYTQLTDRFRLHFFELPKLPDEVDEHDEFLLWLSLFKAETEEYLARIKATGVKVMQQAIEVYRRVVADSELKEIVCQRHYAAHSKASALGNARHEGERAECEKWQGVIADKEAVIANKDAQIVELLAWFGSSK